MLSSLWNSWITPYKYMVVVSLLTLIGSFFLPLNNEKYSTIAFILIASTWGAVALCWFVVATLLLKERKRLLDRINLMETYGVDVPLNIDRRQLGFHFLNPKEVSDG